MSQVQITGKLVNGQQLFQSNDFRKQTIIVEVVNGSYTSYLPIDFINQDIDTLCPQLVMGGTFTFTCYLQGSNKQFTDKNNQPTAYLNLKATALVPVQQAAAPQPPAQQFAQPQQQGFAPQQPQQGFAAPAQAPAPSFAPPAQPGIGQPQGGQSFAPPAQQAPNFAPPQQQAAPATPPQFNPNAGQQ